MLPTFFIATQNFRSEAFRGMHSHSYVAARLKYECFLAQKALFWYQFVHMNIIFDNMKINLKYLYFTYLE